jgi:hypothetical protein
MGYMRQEEEGGTKRVGVDTLKKTMLIGLNDLVKVNLFLCLAN